jgi:hypothetical protein
MARIVIGSYFVRYPLGGNLSCVLQYILGFRALGHEVYLVEKSAYENSCYDAEHNVMTNDCTYGVTIAKDLLTRFDLGDRWAYVDALGVFHGLSRERVETIFRACDVFVELGSHEAWLDEASYATLRILIDGDPGFSQIWMVQRQGTSWPHPQYDAYYTVGRNVGTPASCSPTGGVTWRPTFHPVMTELFVAPVSSTSNPITTVMNWRSYRPVEHGGKTYGHKDVEFESFLKLPQLTSSQLEIAVSGPDVPVERLRHHGWRVREGRSVSATFEQYVGYLAASKAEFTVCKNGFVAMQTGWFGDRSAAYLASGRPVVMQETGFSSHLPCGVGLLAVRSAEEAADAIARIESDYEAHARGARAIAQEFLAARRVLGPMLAELGIT